MNLCKHDDYDKIFINCINKNYNCKIRKNT